MVWKLIIHHLSFIIPKSRGFTLIELMVVLSITAVLGTLGIAGFVNYNQTQVLQNAANELITTFNTARSRAQSQIKPCSSSQVLEGYSIDISVVDRSYALNVHCFRSTTEISSKKLPDNITFRDTTPVSFFFPVQTGRVTEAGTITLLGYGREKNIVVSPFGGISMQLVPTVFPTSTPTPAPFPTSTPIPIPTPTSTPVPPTPTPTPIPNIYSQNFRSGSTSTAQCTAWNSWRASLTGTYSKITLKGSNNPTGVSCVGSSANTICQSLRTGSPVGISCGGRSWTISGVGSCGDGVELNANGSVCQCNVGYTVRPCIGNANWGAINGEACGAPDQTMTVVCQP